MLRLRLRPRVQLRSCRTGSLRSLNAAKYFHHELTRVFPTLFRSMATEAKVAPDGSRDLSFQVHKEPLGFPAEAGYGFFEGGPGDELGPSGRYQIHAKLGYGTASSVWLAKDMQYVFHIIEIFTICPEMCQTRVIRISEGSLGILDISEQGKVAARVDRTPAARRFAAGKDLALYTTAGSFLPSKSRER